MNNLYKDGDTFYYVLYNHVTNNYYIMAYKYWDEWDHCFDHSLMFKTKEEAEIKVFELNNH